MSGFGLISQCAGRLEVLIALWLIGRWVQLGLNDELLTVEEVIVCGC